MEYQSIAEGRFLDRPNRFIAHVELDGQPQTVHVKNTGRCRELLVPGATVYLEDHGEEHGSRKTRYDLVAVEKTVEEGNLLINMDSQAPNKVFQEWAKAVSLHDLTLLRPETVWGNSRFDFYWESAREHGFVEVKGVTLEDRGYARFPDAPTQRGVKHLEELILAAKEGYRAEVCFVLQMEGMRQFSPNDQTDPAFGEALRRAAASGVGILALDCHVAPNTLQIQGSVPIVL